MKLDTLTLIEDLKERTEKIEALARVFMKMEENQLQFKSDATSWSALECIAHLNRYHAFYNPLLRDIFSKAAKVPGRPVYTTGLLGQFFVKMMEPKNNSIKKMKAMAKMNPNGSELDRTELDAFIAGQQEMLFLLEQAKNCNLNAFRLPTVMSPWITTNLGDTLRFIVTHNERHVLQAQNSVSRAVAAMRSIEHLA